MAGDKEQPAVPDSIVHRVGAFAERRQKKKINGKEEEQLFNAPMKVA